MIYRASIQNFCFAKLLPVLVVIISFMFIVSKDVHAGYLYVLNDNSGWNKIYGFDVNEATGALTLLPGFPIQTGGYGSGYTPSEELVIDRSNGRLYAINGSSGNVSAYSIDPATGALTPLPFNLQITLPAAYLFTITVHPSGSPLIIAGQSRVVSYNITETTAQQASGSPYQTGTVSAFSSVFSRDGKYLYTGGDNGFPGGTFNYFNGFSVDAATGVLTPLPGSPFDSGVSSPVGYATDSSGRLFMVNYYANLVQAYSLENGIPGPAYGSPFASGLHLPSDGVLSADERFYIVADRGNIYVPNRKDRIAVYRIEGSGVDTTLEHVPGSPAFTRGAVTNAVAVNQNGTFAFAANAFSGNITTFKMNPATGTPTFDNVLPEYSLADSVSHLTGMDYFPVIGALVSVSGRVTNAEGAALRNAIVRLIDSQGTSRTALTSAFGYYRFDSVRADEDYTMYAYAKKHRFTPVTINVPDDLTGVDFIASPK
jgi:6-phosphogluconolactonase (cycloisomerase 2 family)